MVEQMALNFKYVAGSMYLIANKLLSFLEFYFSRFAISIRWVKGRTTQLLSYELKISSTTYNVQHGRMNE